MAKGGEKELEERCEIILAIEELSLLKNEEEEKKLSTLAFLHLSNLLLQVLDKIGPTMAVLSLDIRRNIQRLEEIYLLDPSSNSNLMEIVEKEVKEGTVRKDDSCSRAILWLSRSLDFTVAMLEALEKEEQSLNQIIEASYKTTLGPWHGWIASAAYKIALQLLPEREFFVGLLMGKNKDYGKLKGEICKLVALIKPLLHEVHELMKKFHLERLKST
ncbi:ceramide-1-phosphate transfer protein-like isoform X1 [Carex littledalei]|uniref:Ceramide-1-phosphate transfer protein-like isoform X1 n=1 Tax=Carex littledalei TaxID=544730 RepID=A0A833VW51_9POAL|nr:ceramide-1-phosphate transfer protein-like isoform X1 [Carex littledalei]